MNEDFEEIMQQIKSFSRVEEIKEIILLGTEEGGVRRIILE